MVAIPPEKIQEVRDRVDIERVIGQVVSLKKQGRRLSGLCPFHREKSPSFSVDPISKLYHCFGCHVGGDAFDFVMRHDSVDFPTAVRRLAREFGVELPEREESPEEKHRRSEREKLYRVNALARDYFERELGRSPRALEYLRTERGLRPETIERFRLGFAPLGWSGLTDELEGKRVPVEYPLTLGLVGRRQDGRGVYDRFRGRVIFPITLPGGDVAGFGARRADWVEEEDKGPKYLNSPESPIYDKSSIFYGLDLARDSIRQSRRAILVEGYMDVIGLHQVGVTQAIATCGTALSHKHAEALSKMAEEVITMFDGDAAGLDATRRSAEPLLKQGLMMRVLELPTGEDPDTYAARISPEALEAELNSAPSAIDYFVDRARRTHGGAGIAGVVKMVDLVRPLLLSIPDPLTRDVSIEAAARRLGLDPAVLKQHLRAKPSAEPKRTEAPVRPPAARPAANAALGVLELAVLRHLVENPAETMRRGEEKEVFDAFPSPAMKHLWVEAKARVERGDTFDGPTAMELLETYGDLGDSGLAKVRETLVSQAGDAHELNECLKRLVRKAIEARLRQLTGAIREAAAHGSGDLERLSEEHRDLIKKLGSES